MRKNFKGYIIGFVAGAISMVGTQIFAEDGLQKIEAYLRPNLPVTLNGSPVKLDNPPVMVDGSTYLKLRDVSKLTGVQVNWNEQTQTVELRNINQTNRTQTTTITTEDNQIIYYKWSDVIKRLDELHPNDTALKSYIQFKSVGNKTYMVYEGIDHEIPVKYTTDSSIFIDHESDESYRPEGLYLSFLSKSVLDGLQKYHIDTINKIISKD